MLNDFTPTGVSQLNLFDDVQPRVNSDKLMKVLDSINHSDLGKVWFAGQGINTEWQMKREILPPAYTTRWSELPTAKIFAGDIFEEHSGYVAYSRLLQLKCISSDLT